MRKNTFFIVLGITVILLSIITQYARTEIIKEFGYGPDFRIITYQGSYKMVSLTRNITIWDIDTHDTLLALNEINCIDVAIAPSGNKVVLIFKYGTFKIYDINRQRYISDGQYLSNEEISALVLGEKFMLRAVSVKWMEDKQNIAFIIDYATYENGRIYNYNRLQIWDMNSNSQIFYKYLYDRVFITQNNKYIVQTNNKKDVYIYQIYPFKQILNINIGIGVSRVALSPDGSKIAVGEIRGLIKIYDINTGQEIVNYYNDNILTIDNNNYLINNILFSPDSKRLLIGFLPDIFWKLYFEIFNCSNGTIEQKFHTLSVVGTVYWSIQDRIILIRDPAIIEVWDPLTGKLEKQILEMQNLIKKIKYSPDGKFIAAVDSRLTVWDEKSGEPVIPLSRKYKKFTFSPDKKNLAVYIDRQDDIQDFNIINLNNYKIEKDITLPGMTVKWRPHSNDVFASRSRSVITFFNSKTRQFLKKLPGIYSDFAWSPDGNKIAAVQNKYILIWDYASDSLLFTIKEEENIYGKIKWSPDCKKLFYKSNYINIWDINSRKKVFSEKVYSHSTLISWKKNILVIGGGSQIKIYDIENNELLKSKGLPPIDNTYHSIESMTWNSDENKIAISSYNTLIIYDLEKNDFEKTIKIPYINASYLLWTNNDKKLISCFINYNSSYKDYLISWDVETGKEIKTININKSLPIEYNTVKNTIVFGNKLWNLNTDEIKTISISYKTFIPSISIKEDGSEILFGTNDGVKLYSADSNIINLFPGFNRIEKMDYLYDNKILTIDDENNVYIWDVDTGLPFKTFTGIADYIISGDRKVIALIKPEKVEFFHSDDMEEFNILNVSDFSSLTDFSRGVNLLLNYNGSQFLIYHYGNIYIIDTFNKRIINKFSFLESNSNVYLKWNPVNNILAVYNGMIYLIDVLEGKIVEKITGHLSVFDWSPDGTKLAYSDVGIGLRKDIGIIKIWEVKSTSVENDIENNLIDNAIVSPNPATDFIDITTKDVMLNEVKHPFLNLKVYDVLGTCVLTHPIAPSRERESVRIDVSGLAAGVYFVRVGGQMYKFVKL